MASPFEALIEAATRAPSGDNTQPWRFDVDSVRQRITIQVDEGRDPSPMNAGQRMARIAVGAAIENLIRLARQAGWSEEVNIITPLASTVTIGFTPSGSPVGGDDEPPRRRVTNRRLYDGRPVPAEILDRLRAETTALSGVVAHWMIDRRRIDAAAAVIQEADRLMFGEPAMRLAFLANVRFDRPATEEVEEGLSLASLELSPADRLGLRLLPYLPDRAVRLLRVVHQIAAQSRRLVESASGICLILTDDTNPAGDFLVGRVMQSAWLALTAAGLAAQPMMSLPVLENALQHGTESLRQSLGSQKVGSLIAQFREVFPEAADRRIAFLLRFGYAPPPSGRNGRRPLGAVMALQNAK